MLPDRTEIRRGIFALLAISAVSLLFIASYAGALHEPRPHEIPVAVAGDVPAEVATQLDRSPAFAAKRVADAAAARRAIDRRDAYGAVIAEPGGLVLLTAAAASPAVAGVLSERLAPELRRGGGEVTEREVHPLPDADARGLVGFYTAVGWVVAGYLGATFFGLIFGTRPGRLRTAWRLTALAALALVTGFAGAALAAAIGDFGGSVLLLGVVGALTVAAVGAVTVALQSVFGVIGTGVAILVFVIVGNPSAGGPFPAELLPGFWRTVGPFIPTGAATTAIRDVAYFPDASIAGPLLVLLVWLAAGALVALLLGGRRRGDDTEAEAAFAAAAAP
jgi:hypothetical protein